MSRGEPIASPVDPTLDGYKGHVTLAPVKPTGGPSKVSDPTCEDCGMQFRPTNPKEIFCPECRRKPEHRERLHPPSKRDEAIRRAEQRWSKTRQKWGM